MVRESRTQDIWVRISVALIFLVGPSFIIIGILTSQRLTLVTGTVVVTIPLVAFLQVRTESLAQVETIGNGREKIVDALRRKGPQQVNQLQKETGLKRSPVYLYAKSLVDKKRAEWKGHLLVLKETIEEQVRAIVLSSHVQLSLEEVAVRIGIPPNMIIKEYYNAAKDWKAPKDHTKWLC